MSNFADRLIVPLAALSIAVALSIIFATPWVFVGAVIGAFYQARLERERAKRRIIEARLQRSANLLKRYGRCSMTNAIKTCQSCGRAGAELDALEHCPECELEALSSDLAEAEILTYVFNRHVEALRSVMTVDDIVSLIRKPIETEYEAAGDLGCEETPLRERSERYSELLEQRIEWRKRQGVVSLNDEEASVIRSLADHRDAFHNADEIDLYTPRRGETPVERLRVRARSVEMVADLVTWAEAKLIPRDRVGIVAAFLSLYKGHKERTLSEDRESNNTTGDVEENEGQLARIGRLLARLETVRECEGGEDVGNQG